MSQYPQNVIKGNAVTGVRCSIEPGSGNYHFALAGCDDCDIRDLSRRSLAWVEDRYRTGYVRQAMFEAYMHVWATEVPRLSGIGQNWETPPTDPEVAALVELFCKVVAERKAA